MAEMKTLTLQVKDQEGLLADKTYEIVDGQARSEIETIKSTIDSLVNTGGSIAVTVNSIPADETGNIALAAKDVGALSIDKTDAVTGTPVLVNADTLGGIAADQYALKSDIPEGGTSSGGTSSGEEVTICIPSGGTTGQILAKASDTDYETQWIDPPTSESGTDDPIDADTLEGKTLSEIKTEILVDSEVDADKLDGMTFEQLKAAILAEVVYQ